MSEEIPQKDIDIINNVNSAAVEPKDLSKEAPVQEELDIAIKEKQKEEKTKVNYKDSSYLKNILNTPKEQPGGGTVNNDDVKKRLLGDAQPLSDSTSQSNDGDNDGVAELIVEILDWLLVEGITFYACAETSKPYETDKEKKKILKKYLAKWLQKKSVSYPTEYFLFAAFISTYFISAVQAHKDRNVNKPIKEAKERIKRQSMNYTGEKKKRRVKDDAPFVEAE